MDSTVMTLDRDAVVPVDPHLVYDLARDHPEVTTLAAAGIGGIERAADHGLVPLGLPLPRGRRDLVVPALRQAAILREICGQIDRAQRRDALLAQGRRVLEGWRTALVAGPDRTRVRAVMTGDLPWRGLPMPVRLQVTRPIDALELSDLGDDDLALRLDADPVLTTALDAALSRIAARLRDYAAAIEGPAAAGGGPDDDWTFAAFGERLARAARGHFDADDILARWDRDYDQWRRDRAEARGRDYVDRHFDFARFERLFPIARGLGRRLVLIIGPTNSGKTHRAIAALRAARDGVYLAPLRLLALEVAERLNAEGTPTTLLTGEEEVPVAGARHVASTIEMMDPERPVEVAVIDEVQMLADPARGWAWTAALLGVPAQTVLILGAPEVRPLIERVAADLGEPLEVIVLERLTPLTMLDRRLDWAEIVPGDALIAFSRREIHATRDALQARGLSVATVYGALAPTVRRREAARFVSGEADVVVATDAIGMGLNLPCRRVLFTALEKFDGTAVRPLSATEVRQIAGRAGRFGKVDAGEFGVVARGTPQALRRLLEQSDDRLRPTAPLAVRPSRAMMARLAQQIGTSDCLVLVDCFAGGRTAGSPYRVSDLSALRRLALRLDERRLTLAVRLDLLLAPIDQDEEVDMRLFTAILDALETQQTLPIGRVIPARLDGLDAAALEGLSRSCDLYYWAARRFPALLPDRGLVQARRDQVCQRLAALLASGARRREPPPQTGFRGAPRQHFGPRRRR
ncbi:MAG: helicase-related protein [Azospirillaceae bacterium]|nr:helicase-related protein [Azospirillaceae bacterium]